MSDDVFFSPSDAEFHVPSEGDAYFDPTRVRRTKDGRPYVKLPCPARAWTGPLTNLGTCENGRVPSEKRPGKTVQCPKCKGKGFVERAYTRCTSFVGVLEDKTGVEKWRARIILTGLGIDHGLQERLGAADPDDRETLNRLADDAFEVGEGHAKAQKGTDLHRLSEYVDRGMKLPDQLVGDDGVSRPVTLQDRADMAAWLRTRTALELTWLDLELFVVHDGLGIGGTYDRRAAWPDSPCDCGKPVVVDLKTGRVDYGAGKMTMQTSVYAHSENYDPETGERTEQDVCTHVALIIHLPQGTGEATVYLADIGTAWHYVQLCAQVRDFRRAERGLLSPLEVPDGEG